jgi:hypothetical protein
MRRGGQPAPASARDAGGCVSGGLVICAIATKDCWVPRPKLPRVDSGATFPIGCNIFPGANAGDFPMEYVSP